MLLRLLGQELECLRGEDAAAGGNYTASQVGRIVVISRLHNRLISRVYRAIVN